MNLALTQLSSGCQGIALLERAVELGVSAVEPMIFPADCQYMRWSSNEIQHFADRANELNIKISAVALGVFTADDALVCAEKKNYAIDLITKSLNFTSKIGAKMLMLCNYFASAPDTPAKRANTIGIVRHVALIAKNLNLTIGLESPDPAEELIEMLRDIGAENVGIYYDVGNTLFLKRNPVNEIKRLDQLIVGMHMKDTCKSLGDSHLKQGRLDLDAVIQAMREINYNGWLTLETLPDEENALLEDIKILRNYL